MARVLLGRRRPARATRCTTAMGTALFTGGLGFHDGRRACRPERRPRPPPATPRAICCCCKISGPPACAPRPRSRCTSPRRCRSRGVTPRALGLRYGLYGAEPWTEGMRAALGARLRLPGPTTSTACRRSSGRGGWRGNARARDWGLHLADDPLPAGESSIPADQRNRAGPVGEEGGARADHAHPIARRCPCCAKPHGRHHHAQPTPRCVSVGRQPPPGIARIKGPAPTTC